MLKKKPNRVPVKTALIVLSCILISLTFFAACSWMNNRNNSVPFISYRVTMKNKGLDLVNVTASVHGANEEDYSFQAVKSGGRLYPDPLNITAVTEDDEKLPIEANEGKWTVKNGNRDFSLSYDVITMREDRFSSRIRSKITHFDESRFRVLGRDIFLVPASNVSEGIIVDFNFFPEDLVRSVYKGLGTRVILPGADDMPMSLYAGGDYSYLTASAGGTEVLFASVGGWAFKDERMLGLIRDIVSYEIGMFGSAPDSRYLFICDRNPVLGSKGFDYYGTHSGQNILLLFDPRMDESDLFDIEMSVISHEFFHNWNGKALSPVSDSFMWFTEGVTVYYSYKILLDLGIISERRYKRKMDSIMERYKLNPYLRDIPIASSGNSDMRDKDLVNFLYDGGFMAARAIDRHLIDVSEGKTELIDILSNIYNNGKYGTKIDEKRFTAEVKEITGHDISGYLRMLVHTTAPDIILGGEEKIKRAS
ncbi:MAG: M1 family aminopeptidase [Candidatus Krumholzibacteriota bacterium]|nr:M1 family aminopeptidase [Candidatus Krumholzibacteriota bacterium]